MVREQLRRLAGLDVAVEVEPVPGDVGGLRWRTRQRYVDLGNGRRGMRKHRSHEVVPVDDCLLEAAQGPVHEVHGRAFEVAPGGFWQVHPGAPAALVDAVLAMLDPQPGETALDLYAGVGLFSRFLVEAVGPTGRVVAVEGDPTASRLSRTNCPGVVAVPGDVAEVLAGDPADGLAGAGGRRRPRPPARRREATGRGAGRPRRPRPAARGAKRPVVEQVVARSPRAVAYVACDPAALARDLAIFAEHGYALERLRAFDLFPMTHHVECVALLEKTGSDLRRSVSD